MAGMFGKIVRTVLMLPVLGFVAIVATSCTQLGLNYASLETDNKPAAYPPLEITSAADWTATTAPDL
ncbi:MAG: hypothetical protein AAGJ50_11620, partial [Pseudomonadota bacterium]